MGKDLVQNVKKALQGTTLMKELVVTPNGNYSLSDDMLSNLQQTQTDANARNRKAKFRMTRSMNLRVHPFFSEIGLVGAGTLFPWTNLAMGTYYAGDAIKDMKENGMNLGNSAQLALSTVPFSIPAKRAISPALVPIKKRAIEVAMRTTSLSDPMPKILEGIKSLDRNRAYAIGKYIVSGKSTGDKGYYNSLAEDYNQYYTGFGHDPIYHNGTKPLFYGNDAVDAYLYSKPIDPRYRLKKVATGSDFGPHSDYITLKYPSKAKDIPVYEFETAPYDENIGEIVKLDPWKGKDGRTMLNYNKSSFNANGHLYLKGYNSDGTRVIRLQDIWKFNPDEYTRRYKLYGPIYKWGLNKVNKYGTPLIVRTPWSIRQTHSYNNGGKIKNPQVSR